MIAAFIFLGTTRGMHTEMAVHQEVVDDLQRVIDCKSLNPLANLIPPVD